MIIDFTGIGLAWGVEENVLRILCALQDEAFEKVVLILTLNFNYYDFYNLVIFVF